MTRIWIGGFEAFPPYRENPSWVAAQALAKRLESLQGKSALGELEVAAECLPVDFERTVPVLAETLAAFEPQAVLLLGLSGLTPFLELEQVALNVGEPAVEGETLRPAFPLSEAQPPARHNPIDWGGLARELRAEGIPARHSFHAGTFLCNAAYFHALGWREYPAAPRHAAFVHMPLLPDQAARHYERTKTLLPSLDLAQSLPALERVLERLLDHDGASRLGI